MKLIPIAAAEEKIGKDVKMLISTNPGTIAWDSYIKTAIDLVFFMSAVVVFVFLLLGAYEIISANGNRQSMESGKSRIVWALAGLVVVAGGFIIWKLMMEVVGMSKINTVGL